MNYYCWNYGEDTFASFAHHYFDLQTFLLRFYPLNYLQYYDQLCKCNHTTGFKKWKQNVRSYLRNEPIEY